MVRKIGTGLEQCQMIISKNIGSHEQTARWAGREEIGKERHKR
jgi:hypothetical protein